MANDVIELEHVSVFILLFVFLKVLQGLSWGIEIVSCLLDFQDLRLGQWYPWTFSPNL